MKKCDELLKKAEVFEKLALYGDRKSFLNAIAQAGPTSHPGDIEEETPFGPPVAPPVTVKETVIPSGISPNVQKMLNELLKGKITPLDPDGELGTFTRAALKLFGETYHKPGTPDAVMQTYKQKQTSAPVAKTPIHFDPNFGARDVGGPSNKPSV